MPYMCRVTVLIVLQAIGAWTSSGVAPLVTLRDGRKMPQLALGTWLGNDTKGRIVPKGNEVVPAVGWAIDAGYRHIDTAAIYHTEDQVGRAVNNKIKDGVVTRDDVFITTKLWGDSHEETAVVPALRESLKKLDMEYVDLYLIHWPVAEYKNRTTYDVDYLDTWRGMIEAKKLGLAKSIGVSNFNQQQIQRLTNSTGETPAVLQVELNLNLQQPSLLSYCKEHNIAVTAYTPFGSLFPSKAKQDAPQPRADNPTLKTIADRHNKTVPQIALRYLVELGATPLPKSLTKSRIEDNIDIFDFTLNDEEKADLRSFDVHHRTIQQSAWKQHPYYPFEREEHKST